jgi:competence protein ComEC
MRLFFVVLVSTFVVAAAPSNGTLEIYLVEVEGGNAALVVSPSGESLLIDTGNLKTPIRDAGRILAALKDAGVAQIDHLLTTHWHLDHFGGIAELARQVPVREFIDHGDNVQRSPKADAFLQKTYPLLYSKTKHTAVKPGDAIPVARLDVRVVTSAGETITTPLPGAGMPNPYCANFNPGRPDRARIQYCGGAWL